MAIGASQLLTVHPVGSLFSQHLESLLYKESFFGQNEISTYQAVPPTGHCNHQHVRPCLRLPIFLRQALQGTEGGAQGRIVRSSSKGCVQDHTWVVGASTPLRWSKFDCFKNAELQRPICSLAVALRKCCGTGPPDCPVKKS